MIEQDELLANFVDESLQHLQTIEPDLLEMEKNRDNVDSEVVNSVFRAIHSVKGASGFFGLKNIGELSHKMENLLSLLRDSKISLTPELIDALLAGVDSLRVMVEDVGESDSFDIKDDLKRIQVLLESDDKNPPKTVSISEKTENDDSRMFDFFEDDIKRFIKTGMHVYSLKLSLKKDITEQGKTPYDFINNMESTGQYVDSMLDINSVNGLSDCMENDLTFIFVYASILEPDLVPVALEVPQDRITVINIDEYKEKHMEDLTSVQESNHDQAEQPDSEVITAEQPAEQPVDPLVSKTTDKKTEPAEKASRQIQAEEKIRVGVNFLNDLVNLAGELVLGRNQLLQIALPLIKDRPGLNPVVQHVSRITTEMQEKIMQMRMQPVSVLFGKFHRVVRDLAKKLNKEIDLKTSGEEVELDKTIIEALSDPLTHLIRNCVDHAIEFPEEREKAGKPRRGTIELKAYHEAGQVHLEVVDNGAGIDACSVGRKAVEKGVITDEQVESMTEKEMLRLIFKPGFSTAKEVSDVSGRGVGMDVVITNIAHLGGTVDIDTSFGKGTSMKLVLPLTLAIVSGLVIKAADQNFIIPEANIEELVRIKPDEIESRINVVHDALVLRLRESLLPLINLKEILGLSDNTERGLDNIDRNDPVKVLVTRHGSSRMGVVVESLENIEEIVVKPLPRYLKKLKCYSGASIMGNGTVSLILDIAGIVEKAKLHFTEDV